MGLMESLKCILDILRDVLEDLFVWCHRVCKLVKDICGV